MIDNSSVEINEKKYNVSEVIEYKDFKYIYLTNEENIEDFCVRKQITEDDKNYLVGLDSEEELIEALKLYEEKNK